MVYLVFIFFAMPPPPEKKCMRCYKYVTFSAWKKDLLEVL